MSEALYFRLAGPLQSWAGPAITGNFVRTQSFPTHTGLIGLTAGICGYPRDQWPTWLNSLTYDVRIDQHGRLQHDFHTIAPHDDEMMFRRRLVLAMGKRPNDKIVKLTPDAQGSTSIVERTYISNGEFLVRLCAPEEHMAELVEKFRAPDFSTYLGRKAFAPTFPFFLGVGDWNAFSSIPVYDPKSQENSKEVQYRSHGTGTSNAPNRIYPKIVQSREAWLQETKSILRMP